MTTPFRTRATEAVEAASAKFIELGLTPRAPRELPLSDGSSLTIFEYVNEASGTVVRISLDSEYFSETFLHSTQKETESVSHWTQVRRVEPPNDRDAQGYVDGALKILAHPEMKLLIETSSWGKSIDWRSEF